RPVRHRRGARRAGHRPVPGRCGGSVDPRQCGQPRTAARPDRERSARPDPERAGLAGVRWAWAEIDLGAIQHNVELVRAATSPTPVWAVVKADGYGHGAAPVAAAALGSGAKGLCVALTQEGAELRAAGIDAPILLLSEQPAEDAAA